MAEFTIVSFESAEDVIESISMPLASDSGSGLLTGRAVAVYAVDVEGFCALLYWLSAVDVGGQDLFASFDVAYGMDCVAAEGVVVDSVDVWRAGVVEAAVQRKDGEAFAGTHVCCVRAESRRCSQCLHQWKDVSVVEQLTCHSCALPSQQSHPVA